MVVVDRPDSVQSALFAVQQFPKRSEPGFEVREVMGKVVGGLFTSRINLNLREEHAFTYGAFAQPIASEQWGAFFASTSVRTDVTADALRELVKELEKAKNPALGAPIEPAEVARAKADLIHTLGASLEHGSRLAEAVTTLFVDALPADYDARYPSLLEPIDAAAVTQAAKGSHARSPDGGAGRRSQNDRAFAHQAGLHRGARQSRAHRVAISGASAVRRGDLRDRSRREYRSPPPRAPRALTSDRPRASDRLLFDGLGARRCARHVATVEVGMAGSLELASPRAATTAADTSDEERSERRADPEQHAAVGLRGPLAVQERAAHRLDAPLVSNDDGGVASTPVSPRTTPPRRRRRVVGDHDRLALFLHRGSSSPARAHPAQRQ